MKTIALVLSILMTTPAFAKVNADLIYRKGGRLLELASDQIGYVLNPTVCADENYQVTLIYSQDFRTKGTFVHGLNGLVRSSGWSIKRTGTSAVQGQLVVFGAIVKRGNNAPMKLNCVESTLVLEGVGG